jgi:hypothetical protein
MNTIRDDIIAITTTLRADITAFRADMARRLETLEAHALNFDQRLNTIHQGIATVNERALLLRMGDSIPSAKSLATADGRLNTIRQESSYCRRPQRSATGYWLTHNNGRQLQSPPLNRCKKLASTRGPGQLAALC